MPRRQFACQCGHALYSILENRQRNEHEHNFSRGDSMKSIILYDIYLQYIFKFVLICVGHTCEGNIYHWEQHAFRRADEQCHIRGCIQEYTFVLFILITNEIYALSIYVYIQVCMYKFISLYTDKRKQFEILFNE